jgi:hypothetical protein
MKTIFIFDSGQRDVKVGAGKMLGFLASGVIRVTWC